MTIDTIRTNIEKANQGLVEIRAQLLDERRKHEAGIKEIDALLATLPAPRGLHRMHPTKAPAKGASESKGPTLKSAIVELATSQPGITAAQLVAALPDRPKKSVENTASSLVSEGKLARQNKGYAAAE